jgi:hypothetical protein
MEATEPFFGGVFDWTRRRTPSNAFFMKAIHTFSIMNAGPIVFLSDRLLMLSLLSVFVRFPVSSLSRQGVFFVLP